MAFLVVLESMTPAERVAFVLHDVFRYSFAEIVGRTPAACRQLASSARRRLRGAQAPATSAEQRTNVVHDFKQAWDTKDIVALIAILDPDVTAVSNGGGRDRAALHPITGREDVARHLITIATQAPDLMMVERTVNGQPGVVLQLDGVTVSVMSLDVSGDRITHIWGIRNPDKLRPWTAG